MKPDPEEYVKVFNFKLSTLHAYFELIERQRLEEDGHPNVKLLYIDGQWWFSKEDLAKYRYDDDAINEAIDLVEERAAELVSYSKSVSEKDSWDVFDEFARLYGRYIRIFDIPVFCASHLEKDATARMIDAGFDEKQFDVLTHSLYKTFHNRRHRDLILVKRGDMSREEFKKKWAWSETAYFHYQPVDDAFIDEQLSHIDDNEDEMDRKHRAAEESYNALYEQLPEDLQKKADLLQRLLYIRDFRYEQAIRATYNMHPALSRMARELGLSYEEFIHLTPDEIAGENVPGDLQERMERYAFVEMQILTGEDVDALWSAFNERSDTDETRGKGVSPGKVTGMAKVVADKSELGKIEKGDIIVCEITTPDYLHALQKVKAIVANIGGFTSHSAIVAREFGIPCVVGCRNATQVFKDGDLVEVDADKGIVRKV